MSPSEIVKMTCEFLSSELTSLGCEPRVSNKEQVYFVGQEGIEHVISCPLPAIGEPVILDNLGYDPDATSVEGSPLELLTPQTMQILARKLALHIAAKTKTPVFGRMYEPLAIDIAKQESDGSTVLRLVRAFDVLHCKFVTRIDCVFGTSQPQNA